MASTPLSLAEAFGEPPCENAWNPGLDAAYIALGHIHADEFNQRLALWAGSTVDNQTIRHTQVVLDRHQPSCDAPQPESFDEEYDGCGCYNFGLHPVTDPRRGLPVYFRSIDSAGLSSGGAIDVTYAFLGSE